MARRGVRRFVLGIVVLGLAGVLAATVACWSEVLERYHLLRLDAHPEVILDFVTQGKDTPKGAALREYLLRDKGKAALLRAVLAASPGDLPATLDSIGSGAGLPGKEILFIWARDFGEESSMSIGGLSHSLVRPGGDGPWLFHRRSNPGAPLTISSVTTQQQAPDPGIARAILDGTRLLASLGPTSIRLEEYPGLDFGVCLRSAAPDPMLSAGTRLGSTVGGASFVAQAFVAPETWGKDEAEPFSFALPGRTPMPALADQGLLCIVRQAPEALGLARLPPWIAKRFAGRCRDAYPWSLPFPAWEPAVAMEILGALEGTDLAVALVTMPDAPGAGWWIRGRDFRARQRGGESWDEFSRRSRAEAGAFIEPYGGSGWTFPCRLFLRSRPR